MSLRLSIGRSFSLVCFGALLVSVASGCDEGLGEPDLAGLEDSGSQALVGPPTVRSPDRADAGAADSTPDARTRELDVDSSTPPGETADGGDTRHDAGADLGGDHADAGPAQDAGPVAEPGSFESVYPILVTSCASCHKAGKSLDFSTPALAHASLVGVPAAMVCGQVADGGVIPTRVVAGEPDSSLLIDKLEGRQTCGKQMPIPMLLPHESVAALRAWVSAGAPAPVGTL